MSAVVPTYSVAAHTFDGVVRIDRFYGVALTLVVSGLVASKKFLCCNSEGALRGSGCQYENFLLVDLR